ncbi:hypothetical protein BKA67DRAFT_561950 [Truncatella angustata]|uniref:F-box domain-containing protein n=1 Tax=Truncatella angustata TaxID=152316 RepID=A0A9P8ZZ91_9PEZI|nr:uncharacterized protein BKA67DRAFT_561950 [Truncatella angustata]KAH6655823.1 hypothetical protein BKA67DRAFT_561950 [Truncatella angustata]
MDPLRTLPAEIVLRILDFASLDSLAKSSRLNRAWHEFIDATHPDAIFAAKLPNVASLREPRDYFQDLTSFAKYGEGAETWKEVCRRWTLLARNWSDKLPTTSESIVRLESASHFVWRFKPDFKRRLFISTSQSGGVYVTDMDTGSTLWSLQGEGDVRGYAHLEYQDGTAVWDRFGNTLEVWKTDLPGLPRGHFRNVALLHHDAETRGFQLSYNTLCVVSTDGCGFVYDVPSDDASPVLRMRIDIPQGAIGHLDQNEQAVMYSMGSEGYHFYDKTSGDSLGYICPHLVDPFRVYHINHPAQPPTDFDRVRREIMASFPTNDPIHAPFPPKNPQKDRLVTCRILPGPLRSSLPIPVAVNGPALDDDDWGAGMLHGKTMAGVSRGGRILVCTDWERALRSESDFTAVTSMIECEPTTGADFDLGGWLSIHETPGGKRIIFEVKNRIYILSLDAMGEFSTVMPVLVATTSLPALGVPVSFMGVYDDCVMSTFTMIRPETEAVDDADDEDTPAWRIVPTKIIRVLSFAPELYERDASDEAQ